MTTAGNVGIGTPNPGAVLDVQNPVAQANIAIRATNANGTVMFIPNLGPGAYNNLAQAGDQGLIFYGTAPNAGNLVIGPWAGGGFPGLRITAAGNVGIGTATPAAKLEVNGTAQFDREANFGAPVTVTGNVSASGTVTASTGAAFAVLGQANSIGGTAVAGLATATSGTTWGVQGEVSSPDGVAGSFTNDNGGTALKVSAGQTLLLSVDSGLGTNIQGPLMVNDTSGTFSFSVDPINGFGGMGPFCVVPLPGESCMFSVDLIHGVEIDVDMLHTTGSAGIDGTLEVGGSLSVQGTKSFKIDDPLDPDHKFLYHASVESSEMMNMYTGNVITDVHGDAVVELPAWFQALNRDFRYQLTVIGQFAQAIVAQEIGNNRFTIKTDKANVKVSWQVTGVRHDAYANAHPMQVEVDKPQRAQ